MGRIGGAAGDDDNTALVDLTRSVAMLDHYLGHLAARGAGVELDYLGVGQQRDVGVLKRWSDADDVGIRLGMDQAGVAVTGRAADALAKRRVLLVEHDAAGRMEGMEASSGQVLIELLDAGLVGDGRNTGSLGWREGRSDLRHACRVPGRAARPWYNTAPCPHS